MGDHDREAAMQARLTEAARSALCTPVTGSDRMNAMVQVEDCEPAPTFLDAMIRLADEGIPVRAIARSLKIASDEVYDHLRTALYHGHIIEIPRDDWPPGSNRAARSTFKGTVLENEEALKCACARHFKASRLEAVMLATMLRRDQITKEQLHTVIEQNRPSPGREETDVKMVDVLICKLRKKLREHQIEIETIWGIGYLINAAHRERAVTILMKEI